MRVKSVFVQLILSKVIMFFLLLQTDEDPPQSFMQNFVLKPAGDSFFIQHDVFR